MVKYPFYVNYYWEWKRLFTISGIQNIYWSICIPTVHVVIDVHGGYWITSPPQIDIDQEWDEIPF